MLVSPPKFFLFICPKAIVQSCDNECQTTESCTTMSDFRLLMRQQEIAEKAGISQQMVSSVTAKVGITSLNSHLTENYSGTICC